MGCIKVKRDWYDLARSENPRFIERLRWVICHNGCRGDEHRVRHAFGFDENARRVGSSLVLVAAYRFRVCVGSTLVYVNRKGVVSVR
jgi:hypothetical protein